MLTQGDEVGKYKVRRNKVDTFNFTVCWIERIHWLSAKMVDEHVSDQNGPIWLYATSGGPCFLSLGVGWLKRTKYGMDWLSGVSTHGWLTHCPLLTCPLYCGFFQSWPRVFVPFTSSGASIAK